MISPNTAPGTEVVALEDIDCECNRIKLKKGEVTKVVEIVQAEGVDLIISLIAKVVPFAAILECDNGGKHPVPLDFLAYVQKKGLPESISTLKDIDAPITPGGEEFDKRKKVRQRETEKV